MGVIKKYCHSNPVKFTLSEESLNSLGLRSEPPTPPSENIDPPVSSTTIIKRNPELLLQRLEQYKNKKYGARKTRRFDNARILQTLSEEDSDFVSTDPTIEDFRPNSRTPLTQLMTDMNSMRIWQYFASHSEEEQIRYLDSINCSRHYIDVKQGAYFTQVLNESKSKSNIYSTEYNGHLSTSVEERLFTNPSFTAEQRFSKVDSNLRSVLKRRHLPLGMLSYLEKDIVGIFSGDKNAVYISQGISSFERMLLHGICQYNMLKSWSVDIAGSRRTKVENTFNVFIMPKISLTEFIEKRNRSSEIQSN